MTDISARALHDADPKRKRVYQDGESIRVPFTMMDAALRDHVLVSDSAIADAESQRRAADAAEGARDAAKAIYDRLVSTGWMNDGAKATFEDEQRSISDGDGAHVTYVARIADAWKATR